MKFMQAIFQLALISGCSADFLSEKKQCTSIPAAQCNTATGDASGNCLKCGESSDFDCEQCCEGCKQISSPPYKYCDCQAPKPTPSPAGGDYLCYDGTCYDKPGSGTMSKAQCEKQCRPSPGPAPTPGVTETTGNMTFQGKERNWMSLMPTDDEPKGMIIVLNPEVASALAYTCPRYGNVTVTTGALVVCPAALSHMDVKSKTQGACWKAWGNYGTCEGLKEDSEDVDFLATLIQQLVKAHNIPAEKIIMAGMSNGGSMAFRFNCERADLITGLAIQSQAYFDPYIGFYDYQRGVVPTGTPQCKPAKKVPFYSDIGTVDPYYGPNVSTLGFRGFEKWRDNYSTAVLGCTGELTSTPKGPHDYPDGKGRATCYQYASCPGIIGTGVNRFCTVPGMGHDDTGFLGLLPAAFADFF